VAREVHAPSHTYRRAHLSAAPSLAQVAELVRSSHERYDGDGYPDRLAGEEIPLGASIIAVCDAFDAMTSVRPYGDALSVDHALAELRSCSRSQFDPRVVRAFCNFIERPDSLEGAAPPRPSGPFLGCRCGRHRISRAGPERATR
jgi:HD-GYP domain-containing protein (c-di-GMP phosphodiesterase class II)